MRYACLALCLAILFGAAASRGLGQGFPDRDIPRDGERWSPGIDERFEPGIKPPFDPGTPSPPDRDDIVPGEPWDREVLVLPPHDPSVDPPFVPDEYPGTYTYPPGSYPGREARS